MGRDEVHGISRDRTRGTGMKKSWKVYMVIDDKGHPWLGTIEPTANKAWKSLEECWGTNKRESKAEGFQVVKCDIIPREEPE